MSFDNAALDRPGHAMEIILSQKIVGVETTVIPTSGNTVGDTQYINFMSVRSWGAPGQWVTNFAGVAYSTDNGENWTVDPTTVRPNLPGGFDNFQMASYLHHDGWLYQFGTPGVPAMRGSPAYDRTQCATRRPTSTGTVAAGYRPIPELQHPSSPDRSASCRCSGTSTWAHSSRSTPTGPIRS